MTKKKLRRSCQCKKCPWKVSTNPHDIPGGYDPEWHRGLKSTIADPGILVIGQGTQMMACHETGTSTRNPASPCIGWLMNQLGPGNNIGLRLKMMDYDLSNVKTVGAQHECFEDTLP